MSERLARALLVTAIALAGPVALALDLVARHFVIGGQPADVQAFMAEHVTRAAWLVVPLVIAGGVAGLVLRQRLFRRARARFDDERAELASLLFATTLAQAPAILGDLSVMLGARLAPAICSTATSVAFVLLIGTFATERRAGAAPTGTP